MKEVKMFSVEEVLAAKVFRYNQTKLAKYLKVNRGVIGRARLDTECKVYCVLLINGKYEFYRKNRLEQ